MKSSDYPEDLNWIPDVDLKFNYSCSDSLLYTSKIGKRLLFDRADSFGKKENHIYEFDGEIWLETKPVEGMAVFIKHRLYNVFVFNGQYWEEGFTNFRYYRFINDIRRKLKAYPRFCAEFVQVLDEYFEGKNE